LSDAKPFTFDDLLSRLQARGCRVVDGVTSGASGVVQRILTLEYGFASDVRKFRILEENAGDYRSIFPEDWLPLPNHLGIYDPRAGVLECALQPTTFHDDMHFLWSELILKHGTDIARADREYEMVPLYDLGIQLTENPDIHASMVLVGRYGLYDNGPRRTNVALRVSPVPLKLTAEDALALMQEIANAVFFELDLKRDVSFVLAPYVPVDPQPGSMEVGLTGFATSLDQAYPTEPLSLYWYARSAHEMPLLQFLAYYQVLEYYFPLYMRSEQIGRLKRALLNPLFDKRSDADLASLIDLASGSKGLQFKEDEQLVATIEHCVESDRLLEVVSSGESRLVGNKNISGVRKVNPGDPNASIIRQVADRIYGIRCRIAHAKEGGGGRYAGPLLPFSAESRLLGPDIAVVRMLAQHAIIADSKQLKVL